MTPPETLRRQDSTMSLAESISKKVFAVLVRAEPLDKDGDVVTNPDSDEMFRNHEGLAAAAERGRWFLIS